MLSQHAGPIPCCGYIGRTLAWQTRYIYQAMNKLAYVAFVAGILLVTGIFTAEARPEYAQKENKACGYCHLSDAGGGNRGFRGQYYGANNLSFDKFDEEREAGVAAVAPNSDAADTRAKVA